MRTPPSRLSRTQPPTGRQPIDQHGLAHLIRTHAPKQLYEQVDLLVRLAKSLGQEAPSAVNEETGEVVRPFDFLAAAKFKIHNVHHSACIRAKSRALVGMGHVRAEDFDEEPLPDGMSKPPRRKRRQPSKAAQVLDPICRHAWQHTLLQLAEDYWQTGNAYLEVVRGQQNRITGLHFQPASDIHIVLGRTTGQIHYVVKGRVGGDVIMAPFGEIDRVRQDLGSQRGREIRSEIIHFASPTSLDRWYGVPQWLASSPLVELVQALHQHQFDFHVNRGVPEFVMLLLGAKLDKKTWTEITRTFDSYVGVGNSHKASAFNLPNPDLKVQVEKLAMDGIANGTFFRDMSETLSSTIVSAHGVPPSLAGILIPGKMGAANEASNALMVFQTLEIGPEQELFETILGSRLGNPAANGGLGLEREDLELRTIIEEMSEAMEMLKPQDTLGRMRQQLPEAAAEGRDLKAGVRKAIEDILFSDG